MAFDFIFHSNFEQGTNGEWDSEADTASQLDFPDYKELARFPWSTSAPYSGAYCMRVALTGGTADAYVQEGDIDIANTVNRFFRFYMWIDPDFTGTADDTINIFEARSAAAEEITFGLRIVTATDVINFGIGKAAPTSFGSTAVERGVWYAIELDATLQTGGTGTIDLYVTKEGDTAATAVFATQVASLTQIAVTHGRLGVQAHDATTTGTILFNDFIMDDARLYPETRRFKQEILMTKSGHVFVGPGIIDNISLLSGNGTDCVVTIYDTDTADTNDASNIVVELKNTAANELVDPAGMPNRMIRGAYISMSGTTPRALVKICKVNAWGSPSAIRMQGVRPR